MNESVDKNMAMYEQKLWERNGKIFSAQIGKSVTDKEVVDLTSINLLHKGVDTIKQLYKGQVTYSVYLGIKHSYDNDFGAIIDINGIPFKLGSGKGGYRYILKNNDYGMTILYGTTYHNDIEVDGNIHSNLKIELSPQFIYERNAENIQKELDAIAGSLLDEGYERHRVGGHLCVDLQGWKIPKDWDERFIHSARRLHEASTSVKTFIADSTFIKTMYGDDAEEGTVTYGKASSMIQFTHYNKTNAANDQDTINFWQQVWLETSTELGQPDYDFEKSVRRFEVRLHHNLIKQFSDGLECNRGLTDEQQKNNKTQINSVVEFYKYLNQLWDYALINFRLQYNSKRLDPFWQLLKEDVKFNDYEPHLLYKRAYKTKLAGNAEANVKLAMGNLISIYARESNTAKAVVKKFKRADIWKYITEYYGAMGKYEDDIFKLIESKLLDRKLTGT